MRWKRSLTRRMSRVLLGSSCSAPSSKPWSESTTSVVSCIDRVHVLAHDAVGVVVHLLDRVAVALLLLGQLARQALRAEEVAEQVGHRVGALDVTISRSGFSSFHSLRPMAR